MVDANASANAFAEKLGLWVGIADAITLRAAHDSGREKPAAMPGGQSCVARETVAAEFTRVRTNLVQAISNRQSANGARTRIALPSPKAGAPFEDATAYGPYRRYYLAHQRDMELQIRPLRTKVRKALANASPPLRQLAELDAAFDRILSERESKLLSTLPSLLEQRFKRLLKPHQLAHVGNPTADNPDLWMKPGGWLARFYSDLQTVLLAELDLRLQPLEGLMEALNNEMEKKI